MRTIRVALILALAAAHPALAQEPVVEIVPFQGIPSRTLQGAWYAPGDVVAHAPRAERVGRRALFRRVATVIVRIAEHRQPQWSRLSHSKADSIGIGAALGATLWFTALANGCGCPTPRDVAFGAVVGGLVGAAVHDK